MKYPADPAVKLDPGTGKFTDGNPSLGVPASIDRAAEQNAIFDEIIHVITNAGLTPSEGDLTQLRQAIEQKIAQAFLVPVTISSVLYGSYDGNNTNVGNLVSGSNFGGLIEAPSNGHLVIGLRSNDDSDTFSILADMDGDGDYEEQVFSINRLGHARVSGSIVWHAGNDGAGSGLDADRLQGDDGSLFFRKKTDIPGSVDLDTYTTTGWYHQNSNANANSGSNYPLNAAGLLEVYQDGQMTYQRYTVYNTGNSYSRALYISAWSNWREIWNSLNLTEATTSKQGLVELATQTEMNAGSDTSRVPAVNVIATYVAAQVAALVDASPGSLDTLNELAAALGDDPNFATTMTNLIATKLNSSAYTAADVLAKLLTVDGTGTGLDADLLDGLQASFLRNASNLNAGTVPTARLPSASSGAKGAVELSTNTEAAALSDTGRAITPGNLGNIFARLNSANGYLKLPGGLILQWGRFSATSNSINQGKTFPLAFPNACRQVIASHELNNASFSDNCSIGTVTPSTTTFYLTNGLSQTTYFRMFAIGY